MEFSNVWMATEAKVASRSKLLVYNDLGALSAQGEHLVFRGKKTTLSLRVLDEPTLVSQAWNWMTYLWVTVVGLAAVGLSSYASPNVAGSSYTWLFVAICLLWSAFGIAVGRRTKWVQVKGIDDAGAPVTYCFADGAGMGWRGLRGGTKHLHQSLKSCRTS